jgi:hypothetical protein
MLRAIFNYKTTSCKSTINYLVIQLKVLQLHCATLHTYYLFTIYYIGLTTLFIHTCINITTFYL